MSEDFQTFQILNLFFLFLFFFLFFFFFFKTALLDELWNLLSASFRFQDASYRLLPARCAGLGGTQG